MPSRNDEQVVEVAKLDFQPKYLLQGGAGAERHVYRLADLVNKSKHVLLPGEATMYQGTDFVGRWRCRWWPSARSSRPASASIRSCRCSARMIDKPQTTQGGNQVLKYEYRILVSSFKNERSSAGVGPPAARRDRDGRHQPA